jgi:hypothetical protein
MRLQETTAIKKRQHITPVLANLHWLPVEKRIVFKFALLTFKALQLQEPEYIRTLISLHAPSGALRSADQHLLMVPTYKTSKYGGVAFATAAPRIWNALPINVSTCSSLQTFKSKYYYYVPVRQIRSQDTHLLLVPIAKVSYSQ